MSLLNRYDPSGSIPFVDIGNRYLVPGIEYPTYLQGMTWSQVAAALHDPSSQTAKYLDGTANRLTKAICALTGNQPATACR